MSGPGISTQSCPGTDSGFEVTTYGGRQSADLEIIEAVRREVSIPVIASGAVEHFAPAVDAGADAVLADSVFHFGTVRLSDVKSALSTGAHPVR